MCEAPHGYAEGSPDMMMYGVPTTRDPYARFEAPAEAGAVRVAGQPRAARKPEIDEVCSRLYIGNKEAAADAGIIAALDITLIVNCAEEVPNCFNERDDIEYMDVDVDDSPDEPIDRYFDATYNAIEDARLCGRSVLVHCNMGISRSATIAIAYVMQSKKKRYAAALAYLEESRPCVNPNSGFRALLQAHEWTLELDNVYGVDTLGAEVSRETTLTTSINAIQLSAAVRNMTITVNCAEEVAVTTDTNPIAGPPPLELITQAQWDTDVDDEMYMARTLESLCADIEAEGDS